MQLTIISQNMKRPSLEEVESYFRQKQICNAKEEAEHFYDYYDAVGWKVDKKKEMADWHAAVRNWIRNGIKFGKIKKEVTWS